MSDLNCLELYGISIDHQYVLGHSKDTCKDEKHNADINHDCHPCASQSQSFLA